MAIINYTLENIDGNIRLVTWSGMANADTGQYYIGPHFSDCSVHVYGTFGAGGNLRMQGSNESGTPANPAALANPQGTILDFTSVGIDQILEHVYQMRPNVTAGDGTTSITVKVAFTSAVQRWRVQE